MKPVRFWFNGGYADLGVPEGSDDGFQGSAIRIGSGPAAPVLRISVLRTRPHRKGGPASAEEALRLTRFAEAGTLETLDRNRAVLAVVVPAADGDENVVAHVWHLGIPGPDASIVIAIFSLATEAARADQPETRASVEAISSAVRGAQFVFFDEDKATWKTDFEDA